MDQQLSTSGKQTMNTSKINIKMGFPASQNKNACRMRMTGIPEKFQRRPLFFPELAT